MWKLLLHLKLKANAHRERPSPRLLVSLGLIMCRHSHAFLDPFGKDIVPGPTLSAKVAVVKSQKGLSGKVAGKHRTGCPLDVKQEGV